MPIANAAALVSALLALTHLASADVVTPKDQTVPVLAPYGIPFPLGIPPIEKVGYNCTGFG